MYDQSPRGTKYIYKAETIATSYDADAGKTPQSLTRQATEYTTET